MVIAVSFARIFYRNAVNVGILPLICTEAEAIPDGAGIRVDLNGQYVEWEGEKLPIEPVPPFLRKIFDAGGLIAFGRNLEEVTTCTGSQQ